MKIGSIFSGIGGLDLGIEKGLSKYGAETVWQVEMDKHCVNVLKKHWPNALQIEDDINNVDFSKLEKVEMLIGGFPCQTFSVAGSRKGLSEKDDRGILWYQFERAISTIRPKWVVAENVRGLLTAKDDRGRKGGAFARVVSFLASRGYRVEWQVISAGSVNAPHLRERVFIVAKKEEVGNTSSKSDVATNREITREPQERNTRQDNVRKTSRGTKSRTHWQEIEQQMGSVSYGICPGLAGNLGLPNYWQYFADLVNWRTPTTMDSKNDVHKHAAKLLEGKTKRKSGENVQISLADQVAMDELKANPYLYEIYKKQVMTTRTKLPNQKDFVDYLRSQTTIKELSDKTDIKKSTIEHWFRYDKTGFSYPSIEDWNKIKVYLQTIKYDEEMNYVENVDWEKPMWPTPTATQIERSNLVISEKNPNRFVHKDGKTYPMNLTEKVKSVEKEIWATPTTQDTPHKDIQLTESGRRKSKDGKSSHSLNLQDQVNLSEKTMFDTPVKHTAVDNAAPSEWRRNSHNIVVQSHYKEYEPWETVPRAVEDYPLRKQKLQALGNAVVPACAEFVGLCISRAIDKNTIVFDQNIKNETTRDN